MRAADELHKGRPADYVLQLLVTWALLMLGSYMMQRQFFVRFPALCVRRRRRAHAAVCLPA